MADEITLMAIKVAGGPAALAKELGIKTPSVYSWRQVPPKRVQAVSKLTGIPPEKLRPDLYEVAA
ncbi:transcriptional regulator [Gluconobacter cadivus]|uniref:Chaperone n=1 Tax=Gluconobacter cadivus TaxID=2728101 RepID=A0ABR9YZX0_9PROT|nr:YdaS family helix-turn-helix protein [Gluconobacter cadivus]MBF0889639.1 chaperone [Gluconobacter cadivus]